MKQIAMICFGDIRQPRNGYALRCLTLAQKMTARGDRVTVYQFAADNDYTRHRGVGVHSLAVRHEQPRRSRLAGLVGFDPLRELRFPFEGYRALRPFAAAIAAADECYIEGCLLINGFWFAKKHRVPVVLDTHCINKDVALKLRQQNAVAGTVRALVWHGIENTLMRRADRVIAISDHDRSFIQRHYHIPARRIQVIPHEVAPARAAVYQAQAQALRTRLTHGFHKIACFIGDLGAIQNIDSEAYIRTRLAPDTPTVHYIIVGNNPRRLPNQANITYTGFVEAIDPYVMAADFCIAPVAIGSGVKTKVLDYLKYHKPVIATPVAMEGIEHTVHTRVHELGDFITGVRTLTEGTA